MDGMDGMNLRGMIEKAKGFGKNIIESILWSNWLRKRRNSVAVSQVLCSTFLPCPIHIDFLYNTVDIPAGKGISLLFFIFFFF